MRVITIAGHASRGVAVALAVTLAAGCDAGPDTTDQADAPAPAPDADAGGDGSATLPPAVAGREMDPATGIARDPLRFPEPDPGAGMDPAAEVPARFRGSFAADQAACSAIGDPTQLTIEAGAIQFHESSGPVTAVSGGPSELAVTAELTGEGETRAATYRFGLSDDGNLLTDLDGGFRRVRCSTS